MLICLGYLFPRIELQILSTLIRQLTLHLQYRDLTRYLKSRRLTEYLMFGGLQ